jgi:hypothetical protein
VEHLRKGGVLIILIAYYFFVISPLEDRNSAVGESGSVAAEHKREEIERRRTALKNQARALHQTEKELSEAYGHLRFMPDSENAPLDHLLTCVVRSCRETGVTIRSVSPVGMTRLGMFIQEGLDCQLSLPDEQAFSKLINTLRDPHLGPFTLLNRVRLVKTVGHIDLNATFTVLRRVPAKTSSAEAAAAMSMATWIQVAKERPPYQFDALLEPRPTPTPTPAPTAAPTPVPVETPAPQETPRDVPPPPPEASFSGRVVGVMTIRGRGAAILDVGGQQRIAEVGEDVDGCTLAEVRQDHVRFKCGNSTTDVYFDMDKKPEKEPEPSVAPSGVPSAAPANAGSLGMTGMFMPLSDKDRPPAPYNNLGRAFTISSLEEQGRGARAGLRPHDRLLAIDGQPIRSPDHIRGLRVKYMEKATVTLTVERNGSLVNVVLPP